jgi:hypothetical protein
MSTSQETCANVESSLMCADSYDEDCNNRIQCPYCLEGDFPLRTIPWDMYAIRPLTCYYWAHMEKYYKDQSMQIQEPAVEVKCDAVDSVVEVNPLLFQTDSIYTPDDSIEQVQPKIECPYCLEGDTGVQRTMNMQEAEIFGILTCYNWPHYYAYCAANPSANHGV